MIILIFSGILFIIGIWQGINLIWPKREKFIYEAPNYSEQTKEMLDRAQKDEQEELKRNRPRNYDSKAKEILRITLLRDHNMLTSEEYEKLKDEIIND